MKTASPFFSSPPWYFVLSFGKRGASHIHSSAAFKDYLSSCNFFSPLTTVLSFLPLPVLSCLTSEPSVRQLIIFNATAMVLFEGFVVHMLGLLDGYNLLSKLPTLGLMHLLAALPRDLICQQGHSTLASLWNTLNIHSGEKKKICWCCGISVEATNNNAKNFLSKGE